MTLTLLRASTSRACSSSALRSATPTTHTSHTYAHADANANAATFWATKNFAAYGERGTWSSIR